MNTTDTSSDLAYQLAMSQDALDQNLLRLSRARRLPMAVVLGHWRAVCREHRPRSYTDYVAAAAELNTRLGAHPPAGEVAMASTRSTL